MSSRVLAGILSRSIFAWESRSSRVKRICGLSVESIRLTAGPSTSGTGSSIFGTAGKVGSVVDAEEPESVLKDWKDLTA
ncbi:hypothetical protein EJA03_11735 [Vibrio pectenicida]|uniref:Uncharacterized protein n=1 Tax=Vibrio pectenicida TaxID=62763 RepID=A0A3R9DZI5_9VIBR|nr:hypothetical protein EJA03_11735 [Vibrio pectenicida]